LALIYASFWTGVHPITHATRRIPGFDLRCSLVVTGGVQRATGRVSVSPSGLFKRITTAIEDPIGVTGSFGALDFREPPTHEVRRTLLPRTWVNRSGNVWAHRRSSIAIQAPKSFAINLREYPE
jgi:hypothetical protein